MSIGVGIVTELRVVIVRYTSLEDYVEGATILRRNKDSRIGYCKDAVYVCLLRPEYEYEYITSTYDVLTVSVAARVAPSSPPEPVPSKNAEILADRSEESVHTHTRRSLSLCIEQKDD